MSDYLLDEKSIHIWIVNLDSDSGVSAALWPILSPAEKERAERFAFSHLKERYILSHACLRLLIKEYLQTAHFELLTGKFGKPHLKDSDLHFNLSHSQGVACMAFSRSEIGVDIEQIKPIEFVESIFSQEELMAFQAIAQDQRLTAFYRAWTRKEAFLKAMGTGLSLPMEEAEVAFETPQPWTFIPLNFSDEYVGTVVIQQQNPEHVVRTFSWVNYFLQPLI